MTLSVGGFDKGLYININIFEMASCALNSKRSLLNILKSERAL